MLLLSIGIIIGILLSILAVVSNNKNEIIKEKINKLKEKPSKMAVVIKPKDPIEDFLDNNNE